jgi:hypothetical protein
VRLKTFKGEIEASNRDSLATALLNRVGNRHAIRIIAEPQGRQKHEQLEPA